MVCLQMITGVSTSAAYFLGLEVPALNVSFLKALRSLRLGKYSKSFRLLLATLKFGFPALCNIVLLLYIVLYVFAMLGTGRQLQPPTPTPNPYPYPYRYP